MIEYSGITLTENELVAILCGRGWKIYHEDGRWRAEKGQLCRSSTHIQDLLVDLATLEKKCA